MLKVVASGGHFGGGLQLECDDRHAWPSRVFDRAGKFFTKRSLLCLSVLWLASVSAHSDYLSDLEAESEKVESRQIDSERGSNVVTDPAATDSNSAEQGLSTSRDAFERLLKENYLGTFGFYKKLPERSRQEIYSDYAAGASIDTVRKKIIDRLLNR